MVFTSTTPWKPRNVKFFQKIRNWQNWILSVPRVSVCREKNRPGFVNISPTLVIDTSTERSSRVLQHENQKIWFFFSKKFEIEFDLYFDLCWRAEFIQEGLNMHLYVDIGDASSSLWGSTSSRFFFSNFEFIFEFLAKNRIIFQRNSETRILIKLQCVIYQWIRLNELYKLMEKLFSNFKFVFEILTEKLKIFKQI